jgi:hypothetical protein
MTSTVEIKIDSKRSQSIGVPMGTADAEVIKTFIDERGRERLTVSVNGCEFTISPSLMVYAGDKIEWAKPTGYVDFRQIKAMGGLRK